MNKHISFFKEWKKKKKAKWSQKELFMEVRNEREHNCVECGKYLKEPKAHNFDHILSKWSRPDLKFEKSNIQLVCFSCHFYKTNKLKYKWPELD